MAAVALIAVGLAAARAGAFAFTIVALTASAVGALLSRGPRRAFFLGCSTFGGAAMFLTFGTGRYVLGTLPTTRAILRAYETIHGPDPTTFKTREEATRYIKQVVTEANWFIATGHSLIALALALIGGTVFWLIARWRGRRPGRTASAEKAIPKQAGHRA